MPAYNSNEDEDLYGNGPSTATAEPEETPETEGGEDEQSTQYDEASGTEAVVPKALLAGKDFKPGDEMVVVIKSIHDDEVVIAYAPEKGGEESGGGEEGGGGYDGGSSNPGGGGDMMY